MTEGPHLTPEGISAAAEGLLSDADQRAAEAHLAGCDRCQSAHGQLLGLRATLREAGADAPRMPDAVAHRLRSAIAAESAERGKQNGVLSMGSARARRSKHAAPSKPRRRLGPALAAAAGVAAIAVGGTVGYQVLMDGQAVTGANQEPKVAQGQENADPGSAAGSQTYEITSSPRLTADGFDSEVADAVGPVRAAPKSAPEEPRSKEGTGQNGVAPQAEGELDPNAERCAEVAAVENGAGQIMDVGPASFDGKPALLAIARSSQSGMVDAYVVTGCPGSGTVAHHDTVPIDR